MNRWATNCNHGIETSRDYLITKYTNIAFFTIAMPPRPVFEVCTFKTKDPYRLLKTDFY